VWLFMKYLLVIVVFISFFSMDLFGKSSTKRKEVTERQDFSLRYSKNIYNFWISYFTKRERKRFIRHMKNGKLYKQVTDQIFRKHGLPTDLFYVGLIESGFNAKIKSRAGAVGPWQFVKGTARHYGLRIDRSIDERRNIFKATEAAAKYFKDLYNIFGSWELALCAYNKGEYGIIRAIRNGNTRDYRELIRKRLIPKETMYYIPKIVAARELYNNPKKFRLPRFKNNGAKFAATKSIRFNSSVNIRKFAKKINLSYALLREFNPDIKHNIIRVKKRRTISFFIPNRVSKNGIGSQFGKKYAGLADRPKFYRVKKGDNLTRLAKKFDIPVKNIVNQNNLDGHLIKIGQKLSLFSHPDAVDRVENQLYRVKRGDSLIKIARRFGTSVARIRSMNSLKNSVIYPTQKLFIPSNS